MPSSATVTGKRMGALTVTAQVINNVRKISIDCDRQMLLVTDNNNFVNEFDISAATTITGTAASGVYTLTVS